MNKVVLMGRLTRNPEVRYSQGQNGEQNVIARYTLAVDRRFKREGDEQNADFISCVAFGKQGEFAEKYLKQGTKVAISGRLQTGSYTNKEGQKVYTCDLYVTDQELAESKAASAQETPATQPQAQVQAQTQQYAQPQGLDGFMSIPDGIGESLPSN